MLSKFGKNFFSSFNIYKNLNNNLNISKGFKFQCGMHNFSKIKQFKIITDPKDVSKLVFDDQGKCKIF